METISHFDLTCQLCPPSGCVQAQRRVQVIFRSFCQFLTNARRQKSKRISQEENKLYLWCGWTLQVWNASTALCTRALTWAPRRVEKPSVPVVIVDKLKIEKMAGHSLRAVINSRPQTCCFGSKEFVFRAALQFEVEWIRKKKKWVTVLHHLSLLCFSALKI